MDLNRTRPNKGESMVYVTLATGKIAPVEAAVPIDSAGDELFTVANPGEVNMTGSITATVSTITEVTNIPSVDLIDAVTLVSTVAEVTNVPSVDLVDAVTTVGTVSALPSAIQGPGNPTIDSYANKSIALSADTADQEVVAAPGSDKQIWVYGVTILADTDAGTIAFQDEDDTALTGAMAVSDEGGFSVPPSGNFAMPTWKLPTNKALEADTVTLSATGWLTYAVVSV